MGYVFCFHTHTHTLLLGSEGMFITLRFLSTGLWRVLQIWEGINDSTSVRVRSTTLQKPRPLIATPSGKFKNN